MFLSSINLKNVRKHADTQIEFTDRLNYIIGGNGVGKTTILEAIYYLCTTKSCVTIADAEVIKFGEKAFSIEGKFKEKTEDKVQLHYSFTENKKVFLLSTKQVKRLSEVIGKFPVVLLSPQDHAITQGYPADRRRFVDSVISQASRTYLVALLEYNRVLKQRAFLLNRIKETNQIDSKELNAWNERLVTAGTEIIQRRIEFAEEFTKYVRNSYEKILGGKENPDINYVYLEGAAGKEIKVSFLSLIEQKKKDEIRRTTNLVGPHRDDFIFMINGTDLKSYGSQGQHKTFQCVLRFAENFYLKDKTSKSPMFLLDDVFGELDSERAAAISKYLVNVGQAIITLTDFGNFSFLKVGKEDRVIRLTNAGGVLYA